MSWPATTRYQLDAAPASLALVQDFVNTLPAGIPRGTDLLADLPAAQAWLDAAVEEWARAREVAGTAVVLGEADLVHLRALRTDLVGLIRAGAGADNAEEEHRISLSATSLLQVGDAGRVRALPSGKGWRYVASLLLIEIYDAQRVNTWRRLKTCRNHRCSAAFFDRSRNNSRAWHDVGVCGNLANLQAHRARKRAQNSQGQ
ncbi:CGNR zinc finger domain-containing protein [Pedococcus sp. 5OH_020]|uniref:CGNR zinc finger domain-containing protein n=1 Tax=Pedococcus sp. 5OH_020 TaxID=2989814 RepID=UPI0022E9E0DC|nr:CGNR zinc finger domain-containing protein [Pedococcus sp. 5OH_020]